MNITSLVQRFIVLTLLAVAPTVWAAQILPSAPQLAAKSYMLMDAASGEVLDRSSIAPPGQAERLRRPCIADFAHSLYFQSRAKRSSAACEMPLHLRAILNRPGEPPSDLPQGAAAEAVCRLSTVAFGSPAGVPAARFLK